MKFIWRSTSWFQNIWSSAIISVLSLIIITVVMVIILGQDIEKKIINYMWPILGVLFPLIIIIRKPKSNG